MSANIAIKAVFVDVDDTLFDFAKCAEYSMFSAAAKLSVSLPDDIAKTFHRINNGLWDRVQRGEITTDTLFGIRWNTIFGELGIKRDGPEFEKAFREGLGESTEAVDGAERLMRYLHSRYTVCIASNGPEQQQIKRIKKSGMYPLVDHFFISEAIGCAKPNKAFFEGCFRRLAGVKPEETVMIGDSLTADIEGAKAFGIKTCWFDKEHSGIKPDCADYSVTSLAEIEAYL